MSLLTAQIVKNSHVLAGVYFIFLKEHPGTKLKVVRYRIRNSVKRSEKCYQVRINLALFCNLVALILG